MRHDGQPDRQLAPPTADAGCNPPPPQKLFSSATAAVSGRRSRAGPAPAAREFTRAEHGEGSAGRINSGDGARPPPRCGVRERAQKYTGDTASRASDRVHVIA